MREDINIRQIPGDLRRRWFSSADFDLIVWFDDNGGFAGFQLCYDKACFERSLVWRPVGGFTHTVIDDGEHRHGKHKASPILVPDGDFDARRIYGAFSSEAVSLPDEIRSYVLEMLERHPDYAPAR